MTLRSEAQSQSQDGHDASFISQLCGGENHSLGNKRERRAVDHPAAQPHPVQPSDCCPSGPQRWLLGSMKAPNPGDPEPGSPLHLPTGG